MIINKILVGAPTTGETSAAVRAAAGLASSHQAELVVLQLEAVIDARRVFDPAGVPEPTNPVGALALAFPGLRVRARRARGCAVRAVCDAAAAERPDLVFMAQGRAGTATVHSGRASRNLVSTVACPVVLVST
ncbi:MAG: universal stress protein [Acidimicrobiales bacterium]